MSVFCPHLVNEENMWQCLINIDVMFLIYAAREKLCNIINLNSISKVVEKINPKLASILVEAGEKVNGRRKHNNSNQ